MYIYIYIYICVCVCILTLLLTSVVYNCVFNYFLPLLQALSPGYLGRTYVSGPYFDGKLS